MKRLPFWPIAWTLAFFVSVVFTLDVLAGLILPDWYVMQNFWEVILPDYTYISWGSYLLGLVEAFAGGFLAAVIFVPIYNFFASRQAVEPMPTMEPAQEHN
ncbi:MAG: hypothetical protein BMS9Abin28_1529 [Anaerolineae bacterium]|nr:MAG: hypothetical protein BMS9Abin28_1529 [Anaerolineae bacterium]